MVGHCSAVVWLSRGGGDDRIGAETVPRGDGAPPLRRAVVSRLRRRQRQTHGGAWQICAETEPEQQAGARRLGKQAVRRLGSSCTTTAAATDVRRRGVKVRETREKAVGSVQRRGPCEDGAPAGRELLMVGGWVPPVASSEESYSAAVEKVLVL